MTMVLRKIIRIDEEKCDGCGYCVPSCAEGALQVVAGKARLVKDSYCDGLGVCLGECPQGALTVIEMEAEPFDQEAVDAHLRRATGAVPGAHGSQSPSWPASAIPLHEGVPAACPSVDVRQARSDGHGPSVSQASQLNQWPVQLRLLPPHAPFFDGANLTLIADCVPFADPNCHAHYMRDSAIAVSCPKLDDLQASVMKLAQILSQSEVRSLRVAYMEVPCCRGLVFMAEQALAMAGKEMTVETLLVPIGL